MAAEKDPAEVVATIRRSIEVSQRGARRARAHRFKELFGYRALSAQRRELVERLLTEAGILVQPSLGEAGRDDWLVMSLPVTVEVREAHPDPRPSAEWFDHLQDFRHGGEPVDQRGEYCRPLLRGSQRRSADHAALGSRSGPTGRNALLGARRHAVAGD